ncbi:hypothetical protein SAMN05443245_5019 [Paraburkholderia fungorum]|uniref:Uncharacterized protein n=1 Tax=Paraburkholderia fungorum TaxID=134537 RepID=A0A1H1ID63_9BURK|nr:hypothetical protein SAMN05443245_5019 [Paraburkholderia fungorum]
MYSNLLLAFYWVAVLQCGEKTPPMKCFEKNLIEPGARCRLDEFDIDGAVCVDHEAGSCNGLIGLFAQIIRESGQRLRD